MPGKRALLIGINKYPLIENGELYGCRNDATSIAEVIVEKFGFPRGGVQLLLDEQATQAGILAALARLADDAGPDDVVLITFSGHGSQVRDPDGDEADGYDETIVPHDSGRGEHPNRDISDDVLREALARIGERTPYLTVIFDCCHSGSAVRSVGDGVRAAPADERPLPGSASRQVARPLERYAFIAACRDDQLAEETTLRAPGVQVRHGMLTRHLVEALRTARPRETLRMIFERTSQRVFLACPWQHPRAEGHLDREIFGTNYIEPKVTVAVRGREGEVVELDVGAVHGATEGSSYDVQPPGAISSGDADARPGRVRIETVRGLTSLARILEDYKNGKIRAGDRAVEVGEQPEQHSRRRRMLALQNRSPASRLSGKVALRLLREEQGRWTALPRDRDHMAVYRPGDRCAFRIENDSELPVHVYIVDVPLAGDPVEMHLGPGDNHVAPGGRVQFERTRSGDSLTILPPAPCSDETAGEQVVPDPEAFLLIATTSSIDVLPLLTRFALPFLRAPGEEDWTTDVKLYRVTEE